MTLPLPIIVLGGGGVKVDLGLYVCGGGSIWTILKEGVG